ncbi:MAG: PP2C family protein-serine/threonine phosphatase [Burkholderiales bacterium]
MAYEFASAENIGDRKEQQDRVALATHPRHPDTVIAVLADGMGGHMGGALASQAVVDAVLPVFESFEPGTGAPTDWLKGMMQAAHERVARAGKGFNRDPRSTCVIALAQKHRIDWAHCGDSRLYLFRDGKFVRRTVDHSMVEILLEQGKISEDDVATHPDRSKLYSSLGGPEAPQVLFDGIETLAPQDTLLLASDGMWAYFRSRELAALVGYRGLTAACDRLIELARRRAAGNGDNLTVALVRNAGGRKGLFGNLFAGKPPPDPSPLEDCRRFLSTYLEGAPGPLAAALALRVAQCPDADSMRALIEQSESTFQSMTSRDKAARFAERSLDLLLPH